MRPSYIVKQQIEAMENMKSRVEKYGYLLPPENKDYLLEKIEESCKKCKIYLEMEKEIEAKGLEPKKEPTIKPPTTVTTVPQKSKPKKKAPIVEEISLLDFGAEDEAKQTENKPEADFKQTESKPEADFKQTENKPEADANETESKSEANVNETENETKADVNETENETEAAPNN